MGEEGAAGLLKIFLLGRRKQKPTTKKTHWVSRKMLDPIPNRGPWNFTHQILSYCKIFIQLDEENRSRRLRRLIGFIEKC